MAWIISVILATVLCGAIFFIARAVKEGEGAIDEVVRNWAMGFMVGAIVLFGLWVGLHTLIVSVHQVPAGHVGVVYEFGAIVSQADEGLQIIPPWRSIKNADTRVQTLVFTDEDSAVPDGARNMGDDLDSFSVETQDVFIDATINIQVSPENVQLLYRTVGPSYVDKLIPARVNQLFKDETVNYKTVDIAPSRETIRANVETLLRTEMAPFSIEVVALLIDNVDFRDDFKTSIEEKQAATQNALREQERVKQAQFEAQQAIERATGQAEANRILSESLTPEVIQFEALQKMFAKDSPIKIALLPTGQGVIIDPTTLLKETE